MHRVTLAAALLLTGLMVCSSAHVSEADQQPAPTFRASTRLILQTVAVKDKQGRPIEGLTSKDFSITENGQSQPIAFVEYQQLDAERPPAAFVTAAPDQPVTVSAAAASLPPIAEAYRGRRLLILYFDLSTMPIFDRIRALASAETYIATRMTPADMVSVMVFQGAGVRVKQPFTDDRDALRAAIHALLEQVDPTTGGEGASVDPAGAFGEDDATFNLFTTDRQLSALQTAVTDLAPLPEVKTLIYFGSGLRLNGSDNQAQLRATVNAAVRANVTLNPIDARGLVATAPLGDATRASVGGIAMFSGAAAQAAVTRLQQAQDTLYSIAKDTGGRAMFDSNDLALGIAQAADAVTGYYMIGYYSTNTAPDGRFRRVTVTLDSRQTADLSYRQGYYGDKDFTKFSTADKERQLEDALRLEDPITDIPMAAEANYFQVSAAEYFVPISLRIPGRELARAGASGATRVVLDLIGEVKDDHGVTHRNVKDKIQIGLDAATAKQVFARPIQYETGVTLLPGTYVIKLLVRDATTGRIGTFQSSFTIPNLERERTRLPSSSVVLTSQRVARGDALYTVKQQISGDAANPLVQQGEKLIPSVTRTFSIRRPLFVFFQAYEHDAPAVRPIVAFVTLFRDGEKAFETPLLNVREGWDRNTKAIPILFTIGLAGLAPGTYDCQITALEPAGGHALFWRAPIVLVR